MVYESVMLSCPWLELFIHERNIPRPTKPLKPSELLLVVDKLFVACPDVDVYAVLGNQGRAIQCLRESCLWDSLKDLLRLPFFAGISKEIYTHWPIRWRMYPFIAILLRECVQQHQQLARLYRRDDWSMEALFGKGWEKNQTVAKSGCRMDVDGALSKRGGVEELFDVEDSDKFWTIASRRIYAANGGDPGEPFYFGRDWLSTPLSLDFRNSGYMQTTLDRCEMAASLFHAFTAQGNLFLIESNARRPSVKNCVDWADILSATINKTRHVRTDDRTAAQEVILYIIRNHEHLVDSRFFIDGTSLLPSQWIQKDEKYISVFVDIIKTMPRWKTLLSCHQSLGFKPDPIVAQLLTPTPSAPLQFMPPTVSNASFGEGAQSTAFVFVTASQQAKKRAAPTKPRRKKRTRIISKPTIDDESPRPRKKRSRPTVQVIRRDAQGVIVGDTLAEEQVSGGNYNPGCSDGGITSDEEDFEAALPRTGQESEGSYPTSIIIDSSPKIHQALPDPMINLVRHPRIATATASLNSRNPEALRGYLSTFIHSIGSHYLRQNQSQDVEFSPSVREVEGFPLSDASEEWEHIVEAICNQ
ncbi:hypothetical protein CPB86DRAFT_298383 [Serendipita vermifera]|nr:hypothetical protein CPB86DRAFT_298383 [Serendipita vermifera]